MKIYRYYELGGANSWGRSKHYENSYGPTNHSRAVPYLLVADGGVLPCVDTAGRVDTGCEELIRTYLHRMTHRKLDDELNPHKRSSEFHAKNPFLAKYHVGDPAHHSALPRAFLHAEIEAAIDEVVKRIKKAPVTFGRGTSDERVWSNDMWEPLFPFDLSIEDPYENLSGFAIGATDGVSSYRERTKGSTTWSEEKSFTPGHHKLDVAKEYRLSAPAQSRLAIVNLGGGVVTVHQIDVSNNRYATLHPLQSYVREGSSPVHLVGFTASYRAYNTNADLDGIVVRVADVLTAISPAFAADTLAYTVDAAEGAEIVVLPLRHSTNNSREPVTTKDGDVYTITVTAEDGTTQKVYTLTINRVPAEGSDEEGEGG